MNVSMSQLKIEDLQGTWLGQLFYKETEADFKIAYQMTVTSTNLVSFGKLFETGKEGAGSILYDSTQNSCLLLIDNISIAEVFMFLDDDKIVFKIEGIAYSFKRG